MTDVKESLAVTTARIHSERYVVGRDRLAFSSYPANLRFSNSEFMF